MSKRNTNDHKVYDIDFRMSYLDAKLYYNDDLHNQRFQTVQIVSALTLDSTDGYTGMEMSKMYEF